VRSHEDVMAEVLGSYQIEWSPAATASLLSGASR
jgi:hypothetical protein